MWNRVIPRAGRGAEMITAANAACQPGRKPFAGAREVPFAVCIPLRHMEIPAMFTGFPTRRRHAPRLAFPVHARNNVNG